jgi:hypothetical protein
VYACVCVRECVWVYRFFCVCPSLWLAHALTLCCVHTCAHAHGALGRSWQVARIAAGLNHVVALTRDGHVLAFGSGRRATYTPLDMDAPADVRARSIMEEAPNTLGRLSRRLVADRSGTLRAEGVGLRRDPRDPFVDVHAGSYTGFARTAGGRVYAWGLNKDGQLGLGHHDAVDHPELVPALTSQRVIAIAGGDFHTLALTADGDVLACVLPMLCLTHTHTRTHLCCRHAAVHVGLCFNHSHKYTRTYTHSLSVPSPRLPPCMSVCVCVCACTGRGRIARFGRARDGQLGLGPEVTEDQTLPVKIPLKNGAKAAVRALPRCCRRRRPMALTRACVPHCRPSPLTPSHTQTHTPTQTRINNNHRTHRRLRVVRATRL